MITLLDYGAGNVRSVINAIETLGQKVKVVSNIDDILSAEKLVFPGVGNFASMMQVLNKKNYVGALNEYGAIIDSIARPTWRRSNATVQGYRSAVSNIGVT